jgi:hypothetical protein
MLVGGARNFDSDSREIGEATKSRSHLAVAFLVSISAS